MFFQAGEEILPIRRSRGLNGYVSQSKRIGDLGEAYMQLANYGLGSCRLGEGLIIDRGALMKGVANILDARNDLLLMDIGIRGTPGIPIVCRMEFNGWGYKLEAESDVILFGDEQKTFGLAAEWQAPGTNDPFWLYIPRVGCLEIVGKMEFFFVGKTRILNQNPV